MLKLNQKIKLVIDNGSSEITYQSRVEDLLGKKIIVAAPVEAGKIVPIRPQTKLMISIALVSPGSEGQYQIDAIVTQRFYQGNLALLSLELVGDWQKIQLRDFVRVNVLLEGTYAGHKVLVKDISGGGMMFFSEQEIISDEQIYIDLQLEHMVIRLNGKIVRVEPKDDGFEYGFAFVDLDETTRQEIIQYVYKRQIESRRKLKRQNS